MHGPMAGNAVRGVRVASGGRLSVDALPEFLHFIGVTLRALCRHRLGRGRDLVWIAVAGLASSVAERAVHAVGHMGGLVGVASRTLNLRHFGRVRVVLDCGVAVGAAQNTVEAGRMFRGIN